MVDHDIDEEKYVEVLDCERLDSSSRIVVVEVVGEGDEE